MHSFLQSSLPSDYAERVYAGVLGKIVGVYLGRPFEGWTYRTILEKLGEVDSYVNERLGVPLVVTDDDISGTFTFLRALPDYGDDPGLTAAQIGQTWLNYIVENRTILWWGGLGMSTEHTAYLRLKHGVPAPRSGSIATNGKTVAEQIGAQIFIDGWGLVNPGDPERAAHFARRAGSVSHDGEAVNGAVVVASLVAEAFVERDLDRLLDTATAQIDRDSLIARLIADVREWHAQGLDWRQGFERIEARYGYDRYGGVCHIVPNHALVIHALLHGGDSLRESLKVVNTCGWDTDCNSGNVGCVNGVRLGLAAFDEGVDWRGPVADRLFLPTADGGRCVTDAVRETDAVVGAGHRLRGLEFVAPKGGKRFHFSFPGSVQGFRCEGPGVLENVVRDGRRMLAIRFHGPGEVTAGTRTFPHPEDRTMGGYGLVASPTLYPGQTVTARVEFEGRSAVEARLYIRVYDEADRLRTVLGPNRTPEDGELSFKTPDPSGFPIAEVGVQVSGAGGDAVYLDWLDWTGEPEASFRRTEGGSVWREAWVNAVDEWYTWGPSYRLCQNERTGLLLQGTREWTDYRVASQVTPHLSAEAGLAARAQGLRRYYALLLFRDGYVRLVKELDGRQVLAERPFPWEFGQSFELELEVRGNRLLGRIDGQILLEAADEDRPLAGGAAGFVIREGLLEASEISIDRPGD